MKTQVRSFTRVVFGKASKAALASLALASLVTLTPSQKVYAQTPKPGLPEGTVNFIIPVSPGGGTDLTFRALSEAARKHLGHPIIVVNLPGAGGAIGLAQAATKAPNGLNINSYTSEIFTLPVFQPLTFSGKDFRPFILVNEDPAALVVQAESKLGTLEAFMAAARSQPGKISVGNSGFGNIWHLSAAAFEKKAGIELNQIPYGGAAPTMTSVLGGHIDAMVASPPEVAAQVEAGKMKILAVMGDSRHPKFPEVPTLKEKGIDLSIGTWRAIGAPAGTPDDAIKVLHDAFAAGMKEQSFIDFMASRGLTIRYMDTREITAFAAEQRPIYEALAAEVKKTAPK